MKNSKLACLLRTFSQEEWRRFEEFVRSPYFNKNEVLINFYTHLSSFAPAFDGKGMSKEDAFQAIFPGAPYDARQMGYHMNYLLKLGEKFLAVQRYEQEGSRQLSDTLLEFSARKLNKHYDFLYRKAEAELEDVPVSAHHMMARYQLAETASQHFIRQKVRRFDPALQEAADRLDHYYFLEKLKYSCEMINRQAIISADYRLSFVEELEAYLETQDGLPPLVEIYLRIYRLLVSEEGGSDFDRLLGLIERYSGKIVQEEMREVYLHAINFCARKIRAGEERYNRVVLELYLSGIESKSLFQDGYLSHWTYTNVVKLALRQKDYSWIEAFIYKYSDFLPPNFRKDALHFNLAELHYHRQDYGEVLGHLHKLHFSDLYYHLGSRIVMIKAYYESDELESLLSLLASFSVFLRRNKKISTNYKKTCLNFCNILHHILKVRPGRQEDIRQSIQQTQPLAERAWLLQVLQQENGLRA